MGLRLEADCYEELFRQAAKGLLAVCGAAPAGPPAFTVRVSLRASSPEELLVDWVNELIHLLFSAGKMPCEFAFSEAGAGGLVCAVSGPFLPEDSGISPEVKAATYHGLTVVEKDGLLTASLILDV